MKTEFIKIFDERIANSLRDGGFSYIEEKVNGNQTVYCFEKSSELVETIRNLYGEKNYQDSIIIVHGGSLFF